jgi:hypothetical protein
LIRALCFDVRGDRAGSDPAEPVAVTAEPRLASTLHYNKHRDASAPDTIMRQVRRDSGENHEAGKTIRIPLLRDCLSAGVSRTGSKPSTEVREHGLPLLTFQLLDLRSDLGLAFMDVVEVENSPGNGRR